MSNDRNQSVKFLKGAGSYFSEYHHSFLNIKRDTASRHSSSLYLPVPNVATALALRRFIRTIFIPFFYSFYPHANPACNVQTNGFD